ncbi:hypothetical protein ACLB2K_049914 [Fragaria x ananassa]
MPRIGFTRVQEAWCRVPKSPRESREVTEVMFWKPVGENKSLTLLWRVSPRLGGDCREVASQSALGWGLWLCGEAVRAWLGTVARWPVSPRLVGDCGYAARQSALGWGLSRGGQSVRAWLGTVAMWRVNLRLGGDCREVASQSALGWGLWLCGEAVRAWLGTVARWPVSPRLVGDCGYVARQSALGWGLSRGKYGYLCLSLQCGTPCPPLECLPFWGCFAARVTLASGLLPALHSLDACEGLTRAISTG